MGKPRKKKATFNYDANRRRAWKNKKKLPTIRCLEVKEAWEERKTVQQNLNEMGLSIDPNRTLSVPKAKDLLEGPKSVKAKPEPAQTTSRPGSDIKAGVVSDLEKQANLPHDRKLKLSQPEVSYSIYMMEKYGDNYKAMARDERNYYQDTPKQIKRKINTFKSIPTQYNNYLNTKNSNKVANR